jgi:pimeloyl-ACP methyl ester carboxylesterase
VRLVFSDKEDLIALTAIVFVSLVCMNVQAQQCNILQDSELSSYPNIVLVHGAFADRSSWSKVISLLQEKGYNVTAIQIPLTSLADDVAATRRVLAMQGGPTILVGHSDHASLVSHPTEVARLIIDAENTTAK